jgi:hypothetical protein
MTAPLELDPRWEWVNVTRIGDREAQYVKGRCNHLETIPVESMVTGDTVAYLCLTCDAQLEAGSQAAPDIDQLDALISAYERTRDLRVKMQIRQRLTELMDDCA